jgi:hypothetical protein
MIYLILKLNDKALNQQSCFLTLIHLSYAYYASRRSLCVVYKITVHLPFCSPWTVSKFLKKFVARCTWVHLTPHNEFDFLKKIKNTDPLMGAKFKSKTHLINTFFIFCPVFCAFDFKVWKSINMTFKKNSRWFQICIKSFKKCTKKIMSKPDEHEWKWKKCIFPSHFC